MPHVDIPERKDFMKVALAVTMDLEGPPASMFPFAGWDYFYTGGVVDWEPSMPTPGIPPVTVPKGFVTDLASIPRPFWSLLPPMALYTFPAVIHDFLYWDQPCQRDVADKVLQMAMRDMKVSEATNFTISNAVRLAGGSAWSDNKRAKAAGESRLLIKFPTDVHVTWEQWKADKSNFKN